MENIKVSVFCLVYNHENYLRQCLDGFVNQKCNFKYEVLIHDDASTDNSANIIREYEKKYPNIIKPIYQTENQYSKGVKIAKIYQYPRAKGEYIAWCEGDDYWTDENKLQKQVDFLDANSDYSACTHCSYFHDLSANIQILTPNIEQDRDYTAGEIIEHGGDIFSTNSFMMRKKDLFNKPECFDAKGFGDYQLFIYSAIVGKLRCFSDNMSVYNFGTSGSWTSRVWKNEEKRLAHFYELIRMLKAVDSYYNGKYSEPINKKITGIEFNIHLLKGNFKEIKKDKYKLYWERYINATSRKTRIKTWIYKKLPFVKKIRNKLRR